MRTQRLFAVIAAISLLTIAGCSGVLPGSEGTTETPTDGGTSNPTPTPTPTPTQTVTETPTPTPTATPTPVPDIVREHEALGLAVAEGLRTHSDINETWAPDSGVAGNRNSIEIAVRKPSGWTIKRTEMEVVRETVRTITLVTEPTEQPGNYSNEVFHRPEEVRIVVQNQTGEAVSRISLDAELAVEYADREVTLDEFASQISDTREVESSVSLGENSTAYYLNVAEWRQIRDEQIEILEARDWHIELDYSEVRVEENEIFYHYSPQNASQRLLQEASFLRTYWEAIRNVSRQRLVHRYPERMRLYAAVPGDDDVETVIRTEYAFDFIEATDGDVTDENILTSGAYNRYYPKKNTTRYPDA